MRRASMTATLLWSLMGLSSAYWTGYNAPLAVKRISQGVALERVTEYMILCDTPSPLWDVYLSFLLQVHSKEDDFYALQTEQTNLQEDLQEDLQDDLQKERLLPPHHPLWIASVTTIRGHEGGFGRDDDDDDDDDNDDDDDDDEYEYRALCSLLPHPFLRADTCGPWANCSAAIQTLEKSLQCTLNVCPFQIVDVH